MMHNFINTPILFTCLLLIHLDGRQSTTFAFLLHPLTDTSSAKSFRSEVNYGQQRTHKIGEKRTGLFMVGNVFSLITGKAPSNLDPPLELLAETNIDPSKGNVDLQCVYKASVDGWSAVDFHRCVDGRGSGLVVGLSQSGKKFGGFNPLGWMSTDDYGSTNAAFLWFEKGGGKGVKCPILSGGNAAIFDYATGGPQFGSADLIIGTPKAAVMGGFAGPDMEDTSVNAGNLRQGSSSVGGAYEFIKGWPVGGSFRLTELEVYCNANITPTGAGGFNFWPFS